jgi:hypothetical protein
MNVIIEGHLYQLEHFEKDPGEQHCETLQFIEKDAAMNTIRNGTTNEEVLTVLIDRLKYLGDRLPSRETSIAITKCEEALLWLKKRTEDRKARGVEGTSKA